MDPGDGFPLGVEHFTAQDDPLVQRERAQVASLAFAQDARREGEILGQQADDGLAGGEHVEREVPLSVGPRLGEPRLHGGIVGVLRCRAGLTR